MVPTPPLSVLAFLPPPLLSHLRVVLQPHHTLTACDDWAGFDHAARASNWDAVVPTRAQKAWSEPTI